MTKCNAGARFFRAPTLAAESGPPAGSRVFVKSRFRRYSVSLLLAPVRLFVATALPRSKTVPSSERLSCRSVPPRSACRLAPPTRLGRFRGRVARRVRGLPAARSGLLETRLQTRHEVEHLCALRLFRLGRFDLLSLHLRANDLHQARAVIVGVFLWLKGLGEIGDELRRHFELLWPHDVIRGEAQLCNRNELVGEAHGFQHESTANRLYRGEMLLLMHCQLAD